MPSGAPESRWRADPTGQSSGSEYLGGAGSGRVCTKEKWTYKSSNSSITAYNLKQTELTCSAPTMLIGLHLNKWLINLGMKELKKKKDNTLELKAFKCKQRFINVCFWNVLCELDAELCEVFARGGQVVPDDGHILFDVHDN